MTKADDIRDFQIEGMSIGDSLLDYFTESQIKANSVYDYYPYIKKNPGKFYTIDIEDFDGDDFPMLQISVKKGDSKYKVYMIKGIIPFKDDMDGCLKKRNEINKSLSEIFLNLEKEEFTRKLTKKNRYQNKDISTENLDLLNALKALRLNIAKKRNLPAYTIFHDSSLIQMSQIKPDNQIDMLKIDGVGETKFQKYGELFINKIAEHL